MMKVQFLLSLWFGEILKIDLKVYEWCYFFQAMYLQSSEFSLSKYIYVITFISTLFSIHKKGTIFNKNYSTVCIQSSYDLYLFLFLGPLEDFARLRFEGFLIAMAISRSKSSSSDFVPSNTSSLSSSIFSTLSTLFLF